MGTGQARQGDEPWWVRIRREDKILGAGVLLGSHHVLTCAHVVAVPEGEVDVDFVGLSDVPPGRARVAEGCWVPPYADERGDLALLELREPAPGGRGATLRRLPPWNRQVYTRGFPTGVDNGLWVTSRLSGRSGPGGEWIQMDAELPDRRVRRGFSGSAVADAATHDVVGIVVGEWPRDPGGHSWMIPVDTIVGYLPQVAEFVTGDPAVDPSFPERYDARPQDPAMARRIAGFFQRGAPGEVMVIVTGGAGSAVSAALARAVVLSNRELRPSATGQAAEIGPDDTVPAPGSIDLALDVSGKTVEEVSRRIADSLGIAPGSDAAPGEPGGERGRAALVIDGVDAAADPDALANEVLRPLAEHDHRILVGLREESEKIREVLGNASVRRRLEALAARVAEVTAEERAARERHRYVAARVGPVPDVPRGAVALRLRVGAVRAAADRGRPVLHEVAACEAEAEELAREAAATRLRLDELLEERNRLRGLLDAYRSESGGQRSEREIGLATLYRRAHELLSRGPCDLPEAAQSVDDYLRALRSR
ncbi:trypsin-like peptidase domain-containing protein [Planotetraspora sp. GP83]|uniref:trypsin-like peptidase domain-containing protein n=1 Tax=Planotetraspora sp. GP83 TaxID=3156264 RepID=UPI0035164F97